MDRTTSIRWRSSLITRLAFLWALLIAAIVALFGFLTYRANTDSLVEANRKSLQHDIEIVPLKLQSAVSAVLRDIVYFSTSATVRKVVSTGGVRDEWKELVEDDFRALLSGKKSYFQVRIIGLADEGRELVRVDNNAGRIEVMPRERMQQKGDRDYVLAGLRLQPGEVYLSEINLNQDFGRISEPHIPTLRAVVQLPDESGAVFALLVINVDLRDVFAELQTLVGGHTQLFLVNSAGDYLVHPDPARTFASDLHTGFSFLHDFPDASQINPDSSSWLRGIADGELMLCSRSLLAPGTNREAYVAVALPADELLRGLHEARNRTLRFTGLVVLCAIAFLILAARPTARRLHRVTDAISRYDAGAPVELVLPPGNDEVSVLAEKFAAMAEKVRAQVQSIDAADKRSLTADFQLITEIEYGVTDKLELGLYFQFVSEPGEAPLIFDGIKQRLRYRLAEQGQWPVDVSVYAELAEMHDEVELELKLNLAQKRSVLHPRKRFATYVHTKA